MIRPKQLPLPLPVRAALGREDYFVSRSNGLAVALLDDWQSWPNGKMILVGPAGAGKTHLAHVWAAETGAAIVPAADLPGADIPALARGPICVEDADRSAGDRETEEALFHLHNLVLAEGHSLLLTASAPPQHWGLSLPDLQSRMQGTQAATLSPPDDQLLGAVLLKLFSDRQINPTPDALNHLIKHMTRDFATARAVVAEMDRTALADRRRISMALARDVLARIDAG